MDRHSAKYQRVSSLNSEARHELIPNDKKYRTELEVLHDTVIYGMNQTGYLKHIISKLDGLLIHDTSIERPDLLIMDEGTGRVIGVEHMHVDLTVFKDKKGDWVSSNKKYENTMQKIIYKALRENADSNGNSGNWQYLIDIGTIEDVLDNKENKYNKDVDINPKKEIKERIEHIRNVNVIDMFDAFKQTYDDHLRKVNDYKRNLDICMGKLDTINKGSKQKELMFLIDINMDTDPFYLVHTESKRGYDGTWFFKELVDHIKASDKLSVSYIIISIYRKKDVIDVIAINTKRVESSLNKQDKRLYPYIGLSDPVSASKEDVRAFKRRGMKHVFMNSESGLITDHNSLEQLDQYNNTY